MTLTQVVVVSCDTKYCKATESDSNVPSTLVSDLYWKHGWSFLEHGTDLCPDHNLCDLCGEPWNAEIHQGPADTPTLHLFER